ncbi:HDOD domain-containing protein [Solidesulfovibrio magneticus]|uniref:HDOD domain-containing protein n=1 Tax=Solidesulfovibrio magneticus (strain ATCC 700980 / DSM 13731 / RS-1) TaxID=573370 RepID=C4XJL4_SOLM1|nr:HDOD domain-containing protein [Solidesulfovibrio magneticus]BAH76761.1 hypothetical protein DMR_32700 [Solidesulfovibrio magneticus RS-1]
MIFVGVVLLVIAVAVVLMIYFKKEKSSFRHEKLPYLEVSCLTSPKVEKHGKSSIEYGQDETDKIKSFVQQMLFDSSGNSSFSKDVFKIPSVLPQRIARSMNQVAAGATNSTVLGRLENPNTTPKILAGLASSDPVLTANILKLANSSFFGIKSKVSSLESAINVIGFGNLKTLLCIEILESSAKSAGMSKALMNKLWSHVGMTAYIAKKISPAFHHVESSVASTLGILHDIGKLILYDSKSDCFLNSIQDEINEYGISHSTSGCVVCRSFNLPDYSVDAIRFHHAPQFIDIEDVDADFTAISYAVVLCMANELAHFLESSFVYTPRPILESYHFLLSKSQIFSVLNDPGLKNGICHSSLFGDV